MGADKKKYTLMARVVLIESLMRDFVIDKYKDKGADDFKRMRNVYMNSFRHFGTSPIDAPRIGEAVEKKDFADQLVIAAEKFFDSIKGEINPKNNA